MTPSSSILAALDELPESIRRTAILAGGALRAVYDGSQVKDYDLFFRTAEDYGAAVAALVGLVKYDHNFVKVPGSWEIGEHLGSYGTANFISPSGRLFNLIGFVFGEPLEHLALFDFLCCRMAVFQSNGCPVFHAEHGAVEDASARRITVLSNNGTERTIKRIEHYMEDYGYKLVDPEDSPAEYVRRIPLTPRGGNGYG